MVTLLLLVGVVVVVVALALVIGVVLLVASRSSPEKREQRERAEADAAARSAHAYAAAVAQARAQASASLHTAMEAGARGAAERLRGEAERQVVVEREARLEAERAARDEEQRRHALAQATYAPVAPRAAAGSPVAQRQEYLASRFGSEIASRLVAGQVWQGQTEEMLIEALGRPFDVDEKLMATRLRRVFKYIPRGANRFAIRITLDNGVVVSWVDNQ